MPDLGRWFGVDKLSESYASFSPYHYVYNNPIRNFDPDGRKILTDYKLLQDGTVRRVNPLDGSDNRMDDRLFVTDAMGNVTDDSPFIINKSRSSEISVIGQLSMPADFGGVFRIGNNPFFSESFTNNLNIAFSLFNFLDTNTKSGIEFSLANYQTNGENNYQIATMHNINSSHIKSYKFSSDNLVWSIHNHDGKIGLDYISVGNQWVEDKITMNSIFRNNQSKGF